jgi:hypothetical protein
MIRFDQVIACQYTFKGKLQGVQKKKYQRD